MLLNVARYKYEFLGPFHGVIIFLHQQKRQKRKAITGRNHRAELTAQKVRTSVFDVIFSETMN